jgi:hypothetical protein
VIRAALSTAVAAGLYGFALGSAHSEIYARNNLLKFPLLIAITAAVCATSYWVAARVAAAHLSFAGVQRTTWKLFHDSAILLASLSPVVFFVGRAMRSADDGRLGEYDRFLALNMGAIALAGGIALVRQGRELLLGRGMPSRRATLLIGGWLFLTLGVGGQAAFYMRPFFGFPATRGNVPPLFLGAEPDVRGATNFYEAVWQTVRQPPLPQRWPERR